MGVNGHCLPLGTHRVNLGINGYPPNGIRDITITPEILRPFRQCCYR